VISALQTQREPDPVDLVLTEGFREADNYAIEIVRAAHSRDLVGDPSRLLALVTDLTIPGDLPHFELDDTIGVADLLEECFGLKPEVGDLPLTER
jgi:molybdopterin-guanine dinucleotide biosynthesis protein